jgi:hypothetical protein
MYACMRKGGAENEVKQETNSAHRSGNYIDCH